MQCRSLYEHNNRAGCRIQTGMQEAIVMGVSFLYAHELVPQQNKNLKQKQVQTTFVTIKFLPCVAPWH